MLDNLRVRTFKSLDDVTVELGLVNVFIGTNGSGKSNLLEALGILSAAADGKVDDQALLARGVRPGLPSLYKSAFPAKSGRRIPPHLYFGASSAQAGYEVSLHNPLKDPAPVWRFKAESWEGDGDSVVGGANLILPNQKFHKALIFKNSTRHRCGASRPKSAIS